jgi:hypothetical protein
MRRAALIAAAALLLEATLPAQAPTPPVVARMDAYLAEYERALSEVVARERLDQFILDPDGRALSPAQARLLDSVSDTILQAHNGRARQTRTLESEVAFLALPGDAGWLGFRHVQAVDGSAVRGSGRVLESLLARGWTSAAAAARQLITESAAHNLGGPRTINLPNLPLELLHARHRRRFEIAVDDHETIGGTRTTRVVLDEQRTPSVIQGAGGANLMSVVTAWVEEATGRLLRAEVRSRDRRPGIRSFETTIRVEFEDDTALAMLVPRAMQERFFVDPYAGRGVGVGVARYDRFRRFATSGRLKPPG